MYSRLLRLVLMGSIVLMLGLMLAPRGAGVWAAPAQAMAPEDRERAVQAATQVGEILMGQGGTTLSRGIQTTVTDDGITYTMGGVSLTAPPRWTVSRSSGSEIFSLGLPGEFIFGVLSQETADSFPGLFAIVLFEQQSELLTASMGDEIAIAEMARFETEQGLPGLRMYFAGDGGGGIDVGGGMYIVATGDLTYMLVIFAELATWEEIQEEVTAMSLTIAMQNPTSLSRAGDDGLDFTTSDGSLSLMLPAGWQIQEVNDENLPLVMVDPEMTFVAAGLWEGVETMEEGMGLRLYSALLSGAVGDVNEAEVLALLMEAINLADEGDEFVLDPAYTALLGATNPPTLRIGATVIDENLNMPMIIYVQARDEGIVGLFCMGNMDNILDAEETLLDLLVSMALE